MFNQKISQLVVFFQIQIIKLKSSTIVRAYISHVLSETSTFSNFEFCANPLEDVKYLQDLLLSPQKYSLFIPPLSLSLTLLQPTTSLDIMGQMNEETTSQPIIPNHNIFLTKTHLRNNIQRYFSLQRVEDNK